MKTRSLLLGAAASLALAAAANAAVFENWYISLEGGANWIDDANFNSFTDGVFDESGTFEFDTGWAVFASVGRSFYGNWRGELEFGYRDNDLDTAAPTEANVREWSAM